MSPVLGNVSCFALLERSLSGCAGLSVFNVSNIDFSNLGCGRASAGLFNRVNLIGLCDNANGFFTFGPVPKLVLTVDLTLPTFLPSGFLFPRFSADLELLLLTELLLLDDLDLDLDDLYLLLLLDLLLLLLLLDE